MTREQHTLPDTRTVLGAFAPSIVGVMPTRRACAGSARARSRAEP